MFSDLKFAGRLLLKSPGFTFVAVLALALGIATSTTMFTVFNALLVRPLPFFRDEGTLVKVQTYDTRRPEDDFECSIPDFADIRAQIPALAGALTISNRTYILAGNERPARALGAWITADAFQILGVQPELGRAFRADEAKAGAPEVAVLGHALWQKSFGGSADILGQVVTLNAKPVTVVGVMPAGFGFPDNNELWQPFPTDEQNKESERGAHGWPVYARIAPGRTLQQVQVELDTLSARLAQDHPLSNTNMRFRALLVRDEATRHEREALILMMGAVLAVLLIACGNVANLLLARASSRSREIALRIALGASRGRIIRQVLTESLLLGAVGGLAGLVLTFWETDFVLGFIPVEIPFWMRFDTDWRVLSFALVATVGASVLFGVFPALQFSRPVLAHELKDGGRAATGSGRAQRLRSALVVAQISLALVLLVIAGLMTRSFLHLENTETGIDANHVLTFRTGIPPTIEKDETVALKFFESAEQHLRDTPGVESAGWMSYLPISNNTNDNSFALEGRPEPKPGERPFSLVRRASPGVFTTLRIPLRHGRFFDNHDREGQPPVAVVDEVFAHKYFPGEDPIGHRFTFDDVDGGKNGKRLWITIVGIVGDVMQHPTSREPECNIWIPVAQHPDNFMSAVVRVQGDPMAFVQAAQDAVLAARADIPIYAPDPMSAVANKAMWTQRFFGGLLAGFAGLALFLAAIGIYGVMAYSVTQRTQEIGVRMALGAQPNSIVSMVLRHGAKLVGLGLLIGFVVAWFAAQLLTSLLYGVSPHDPPTFAAVPLLLAGVAFLACWLPSRRATLIDPLTALRAE